MHPLFNKADELSRVAIGAAIEVHRLKGPGLIEGIYERYMMRELELRRIAAVNQRLVRIEYKRLVFDEPLRFDVLVEGCLLLELKCVQEILPIHKAQLLSYMKLLNIPLGLIINFHEMKLICKRKLSGANGPWPKIGPLSHSFVACNDPKTTSPEDMFGHAFGKQPRPHNNQSPFYGPGYIEAEPLKYLQQPHEFDDCREKKVCPKDKDRMCGKDGESPEGPSQSPYFLFSPFHNCHAWANGRCK